MPNKERYAKQKAKRLAAETGIVMPTTNGVVRTLGDTIEKNTEDFKARGSILTQKQVALSERTRARKKFTADLRMRDAERLVALAEAADEDLVVVLRACILKGIDHYERWATDSEDTYRAGQLHQRTPFELDPKGLRAHPPVTYNGGPVFQRVDPALLQDVKGPIPDGVAYVNGEHINMLRTAGILPNGATVEAGRPSADQNETEFADDEEPTE